MASHAVDQPAAPSDRIHLIFEYYDLDQPEPDWLSDLTASARAV